MSFKITGIADFRDILRRLREVEDQAARTGANVGAGLSRGSRDAFRELPASAKAASEAAGAALTPLRNALVNLTAGVSFAALFRSAINEATQLETITRKLSNTLGDQGAAGALSFTRGLSDDLGLSFKTLSNTFGGFTAAATSANVPLTVQQDLFAAVAKSAQSLGLSNDELSGSLLALQQVASKGTVQMEELRGQLGERLPIAFGATARGLGVTQQQLIKLVESGRLTAEQFFPALTKGLNELTASAGGAKTAAQNFAALENAWVDLQASFGTSALPTVTAGVRALTDAIAEAQVQASSADIRASFGVTAQEADQLVGTVEAIQKLYGLTTQEAKNILSLAIANTGATRDWFGELNLGGERFSKVQTNALDLARQFRAENVDRKGQELATAAAAAKTTTQLQKALDIEKARVRASVELNTLKAQEPVRALDAQASVGQGLLSFAKAASTLEQERFNTVRARTQFEIDNAQQLGITQEGIASRQRQTDELKRQALISQYQTLLQTQQVEGAILALSQRKAAVEAQVGVITAQQAAIRAQQAVAEAQAGGDATKIGQAQAALALSRENVRLAGERVNLLARTQPLEAAAAAAARETALQQLRTQGATLGIEQALANITPTQQALNAAYREGVQTLTQLPGELDTVSGAIGKVGERAGVVVKAFTDASGAITVLSKNADDAGESAGKIEAADLGKATGEAADQARTFASNMADAATSAEQLLRYLSHAAGLSPARFTGGGVEGGHRYRINDGPGAVSLGQEAFLSAAGRLSLINAPANSLWTAPTAGTVIPAAMTRQLKEAGMIGPSASVVASHHAVAMQRRTGTTVTTPAQAPAGRRGSEQTLAQLGLAVADLSAEVRALRQKQWTVPVQVRNSAGTTQLRVLNGLT